jgi:pimeloyl-ACP methyl ester carboxylesterase
VAGEDGERVIGARRRRNRRAALCAFGAALAVLAGCGPSRSMGAPDLYAKPGRIVALDDGRAVNLRCRGHGSPTVLLEAGWGAMSQAWEKVQPALARATRVCAYDRAGYGFSDPAPPPRDGAAIVRDLDQTLARAGEHGPYILVGHSAGALYARLFAARHPSAVAGLVLLDPTVEQQADAAHDGLDGIRRRVLRCLAASEASPQPPQGDPRWKGCAPSRPNANDLAVARRPATWRSQLSELDTLMGATSEEVGRIGPALRSIPIYVFTASESAASTPTIGADPPLTLLELRHQMIAAASRDGSQRTVISSHLVMLDRPEVVIDAVSEMVRAARAGRLPQPLGGSEIETPAQDAFRLPGDDGERSPFPQTPDPTK